MFNESVVRTYIRKRNEITNKYIGEVIYHNSISLQGLDYTEWCENILTFKKVTPTSFLMPKYDPVCVVHCDAYNVIQCNMCTVTPKCAASTSSYNKINDILCKGNDAFVDDLAQLILSTQKDICNSNTVDLNLLGGNKSAI